MAHSYRNPVRLGLVYCRMGIRDQMKNIRLTNDELLIIKRNAELKGFPSRTSFYGKVYNKDKMLADQFTGQMGEAALSKYLTGSIDLYIKTRADRNDNPFQGDGGPDLLGYKVDIKTSKMINNNINGYHLWVREKEFHRQIKYYLALIPSDKNDQVQIIGWINGADIPKSKYGDRRQVLIKDLTPAY